MDYSRQLIPSDLPYDIQRGVSRAVRVGPIVTVAGTAPIGLDGKTAGVGSVDIQARRCLEIVGDALEQAGASFEDVIRTRILLARMEDWERVSAIHGEFFRHIRPATTMMQVAGFIDAEWLVEIEADAVLVD